MKLPKLKSAYSKINNLMYKSYLPNIIKSAIEIGLFDLLKNKVLNCDEISSELKTDKHVTQALLEVLCAIEFLQKDDNLYTLTNLSDDYMLSSSEASQVNAIKGYAVNAGPFVKLTESLKGNIPEFNEKMWSTKESILGIEQGSKAGAIQNAVEFIKDIPEFLTATKMCDFAGNSGYYSYALLNENSSLKSCVYDLKDVCEISREIKKDEEHYNRVSYHDFDLTKGDSFGEGYDLFFSSHYLYKYGLNGELTEMLKKINKSIVLGGLFVSNHMNGELPGDDHITMTIIELMTRAMGFPTHKISENNLKKSLKDAGFDNFTSKQADLNMAYPSLLLSAIKVKEV